jgi:hypothetical protein
MCVLIAAAFVVSWWWTLGCQRISVGQAAIFAGHLVLFVDRGDDVTRSCWFAAARPGDFVAGSLWAVPTSLRTTTGTFLCLPLWMPFLALLLPTLLLWRLDRPRPLPGHCRRCGYNLTGLTSARCPECGTAAPAAAGSRASP